MVARPTAAIRKLYSPKNSAVFDTDGLTEDRVPIEMLQSSTIKMAIVALDYILDGEEFTFMDSNLPIRTDPNDL